MSESGNQNLVTAFKPFLVICDVPVLKSCDPPSSLPIAAPKGLRSNAESISHLSLTFLHFPCRRKKNGFIVLHLCQWDKGFFWRLAKDRFIFSSPFFCSRQLGTWLSGTGPTYWQTQTPFLWPFGRTRCGFAAAFRKGRPTFMPVNQIRPDGVWTGDFAVFGGSLVLYSACSARSRHVSVVLPLLCLTKRAEKAGFVIKICSHAAPYVACLLSAHRR